MQKITISVPTMSRFKIVAILFGALMATAVACDEPPATHANADEQDISNQQQAIYNNTQPAHIYNHSVGREQLQFVEDIIANGYATWSYDFSNDGKLIGSCQSIGLPIPADSQLTNPNKGFWGTNASMVVGQMENTGMYTGTTTGTWVVCVNPVDGSRYVDYWEGYTRSTTAPSHWDDKVGKIVIDGPPAQQPPPVPAH